jgi:hypothetical protein
METKLKTHDWSTGVNMTLLSMCIVDSWRVWTRISQDDQGNQRESQKTFYRNLAAKLIDNSFDRVVGNTRNKRRAKDEDYLCDEALADQLTGLAKSGSCGDVIKHEKIQTIQLKDGASCVRQRLVSFAVTVQKTIMHVVYHGFVTLKQGERALPPTVHKSVLTNLYDEKEIPVNLY